MTDSHPFEKPLNRHNSARVRHIAMKFGIITQCGPLNLIGWISKGSGYGHDRFFYLPTKDLAPFSIHIPTKNPLLL